MEIEGENRCLKCGIKINIHVIDGSKDYYIPSIPYNSDIIGREVQIEGMEVVTLNNGIEECQKSGYVGKLKIYEPDKTFYVLKSSDEEDYESIHELKNFIPSEICVLDKSE